MLRGNFLRWLHQRRTLRPDVQYQREGVLSPGRRLAFDSDGGSSLNASVVSIKGYGGSSVYSATKRRCVLSPALDLDLKIARSRVNVVSPGDRYPIFESLEPRGTAVLKRNLWRTCRSAAWTADESPGRGVSRIDDASYVPESSCSWMEHGRSVRHDRGERSSCPENSRVLPGKRRTLEVQLGGAEFGRGCRDSPILFDSFGDQREMRSPSRGANLVDCATIQLCVR